MVNEVSKEIPVGHIPSGLFIVCCQHESGQIDGFLASWVQQVSFNPLLVSMALKPGRPAYDLINDGRLFSINIVGDHETQYLRHFWGGYDPNKNPFDQIDHSISEQGIVMISGARSVLTCRMSQKITPGDHDLIVAQVIHGHVLSESSQSKIHTRKSGASY